MKVGSNCFLVRTYLASSSSRSYFPSFLNTNKIESKGPLLDHGLRKQIIG